ncbi:helix-turn-helix transcriptional regulator [Microlunatus elymi]|uniref:helix-turn-helix transcriptional regulator n=1 Tax=Microlunatus elymi TaxID=2596828 RepID=UPI00143DD0C6|nr:LuxR family transcriptional regulator [Microlunatus elymi]
MVTDLVSERPRPTHALIGRDGEVHRLSHAIGLGDVGGTGGPFEPPPRLGAAAYLAPRAVRHAIVAGEAGIGKTRLLSAIGELVQESGRRLTVGHCLDFGDASLPYLPFTEIFGRLQAESPVEMAAVAGRHRAIHRLLPAERRAADDEVTDSGPVARTELFDAVARTFDGLAGERGLVIMIEDLHWSDPSSRDLLTYLLARRFSHPVSLLVSYRSDELVRSHPLRAALANWSRLEQVDRIDLPPLSDDDVARLVSGLRPDLHGSDIRAVITRAEGNAFFAEELAAAADVRGMLPADLAGLLLLRLDVLSEEARQVVRVASVAGHRVSHELLSAVVDLPATELDLAIRGAVEGQVLVGRRDGYAFRHALLAEAVYDDLLPGERVRLHARYVQALRAPGRAPMAAELARHARASHDIDTAIRASIEAGDEALRVGGPDDALGHYRHALQFAEQHPIPDRDDQTAALVELTIKAAEAAETAGHQEQAIKLLRDRLERGSPNPPDINPPGTNQTGSKPGGARLTGLNRARLLQALAAALQYTDYDLDDRTLLSEALDLIGPDDDPILYARLWATRALSFAGRTRYEEAMESAQRAAELGRRLGLQRMVAEQTILLAKIKQRLGDPESSIRETERVLAQARSEGDGATELRAIDQLGAIRFEQGRLADALANYEQAMVKARQNGRQWAPYGLDAIVMAAQTAYSVGEWDRALELAAEGEQVPGLARANLDINVLAVRAGRGQVEGLELLPRLRRWWDYDSMVAINSSYGVGLYAFAGDFAAAIALHDDVVAAMAAVNGTHFIGRLRLSGELLDTLTQALDASRRHRERSIPPDTLARLADHALIAGREALTDFRRRRSPGPEADAWLARAEAEYLRFTDRLARIGGGRADGVDGARLDGAGADVEGADERRAEQVAAWERAVAGFTTYPHVFERARSQARLAAVLQSTPVGPSAAADGQARARELIAEATATATRLGAVPLLRELAGLTAGPRPADDHNPLTGREREVLDLVADGLSNRDIGKRLVISTKTASVHVSNIMAKLGAESRTEAVAIARRSGLMP